MGSKLDCVFVDCLCLFYFLDVLRLCAAGICSNAIDGMHYICRCQLGLAIVAHDAFLELEHPGIGIRDLPAFCEHPNIFGFLEVPNSETAVDLTPKRVTDRDAIRVRIVAGERLRDAHGNSGFGVRLVCRSTHQERRGQYT